MTMSSQIACALLLSTALEAHAGVVAEVTVVPTFPIIGKLQTTATLQVVSNPLLDREFEFPNGTRIPNPIHKTAWQMLRNLHADHVRWQPWFPYPHKAVPELDAPVDGKPTSWNFTAMLPQFEDFMENTAAQGHSTIWNVGTIPCWMFYGPTTGGCPYPKNPDVSDFGYGERGIRFFMKDPSGKTLADYFARTFGYLINGYMVDEHGVTHKGGPAYNMSGANGHIIEFLNEGEHYYTAEDYVNDYDASVPAIQKALLPDRRPNFMGVGGCHNGHWNWWFMPECKQFLTAFLNRSNHKDPTVPLEYASIHYYASISNRSDLSTYTKDLFGSADKWFKALDDNIQIRNHLSPSTKLALTELGILLVDDMSKTFGIDGGLPDVFFNAAAAFFMYTWVTVAMKGVDIACFSQFVGSPPIPKWGINDMQFPSGSMISWETGLGNAKYWTLMLIKQHLHKGDTMQPVEINTLKERASPPQQTVCEAVGPWTFNNELTIACEDPDARIDHIWADWGLPPTGTCGNYVHDQNCSNHLEATAWAALHCFGRRECTLEKTRLESFVACPVKVFKTHTVPFFSEQLTIQARCTGNKGARTSLEYKGQSVFSANFISPDKKTKKVVFVNKEMHAVDIKVNSADFAVGPATAYIVDAKSVSRSSEQGIRQEKWAPTVEGGPAVVRLEPYAAVIAVFHNSSSSSEALPPPEALIV